MKIGVLGLGSIGSRHAHNLRCLGHEVLEYDNPKFNLTCSPNPKRNAVIAEADALVIATPTPCHYRDLIDCMTAGKPTFVEKPIAATYQEWRGLRDNPGTSGVMVGTNLRMHPCVQQAKEWIASGHIGKPLWSSWICATKSEKSPYLSDGVILNTGAHEVDIALYLFGPAQVVSAWAHAGEYGDDIADFVLEHESGARSRFYLDFITPKEIREAWIVGEDNNIGIDLPGRRISLGSMTTGHNGDYDKDYIAEMEAFVDRIAGKITPGASGDDGLATLRILLDVRKKAGLGT